MNIPIGTVNLSSREAAKLVVEARGMVSVYVVKRKDGSMRRMNGFAAENLSKATRANMLASGELKGEGMKFDPLAHDLIPFYEMVSECQDGTRVVEGRPITGKVRRTIGKQFRNVAIEGIRCVRANGVTYNVVD